VSLGEECPKRVKKSLVIGDDEVDCQGTGLKITKAYLLFAQNLCTVFETAVKQIERDDFTSSELFPVMQQLRTKLQSRINDRFFSFGAQTLLNSDELANHKNAVENNFCAALQTALKYLENWFDFSDSTAAAALNKISLTTEPEFSNIAALAELLGLNNAVSVDDLYDEFYSTKEIFARIVPQAALSTSQKWHEYFKACRAANITPVNMFRIISASLSIPASNAYSERVFSLMNSKWRKERNRASTALMKSELQTFLNFNKTCSEFYTYALSDNKLLAAAASGNKYYWRKKK
jgi:hypothetical protein